jgi:hypothetical protein
VLALAKKVELTEYLLWVGASMVVVMIATLAVVWYRRRILGSSKSDIQSGLLDELRAMKNRGQISEEEFAATKHAMAVRAAGGVPTQTKPKPMTGELIAPPGFDLTGQPLPPRPPEDPAPKV